MCKHPNDFDYNFCQKCGHRKEPVALQNPPQMVDVDSERVKTRYESLSAYRSEKPYQRQKCSLQKQLESYLWSLPEKKNLNIASPKDVVDFLIWIDKFGKTSQHDEKCFARSLTKISCSCPRSLAARTIDNNIGKLRSIFNDNGRGATWNNELNLGNPAAHPSVKDYYKLVLEEQIQARTVPCQAIPMFLDKLKCLCSHLRNMAIAPSISPSTRYVLVRDLAFFSVDFFSGDRGSDLGRIKSCDVLSFPDNKGFLFNQVFGKTLRGKGENVFGLKPVPNSPFCPVANLRFYVSLAEKMAINLKNGYLFRATDRQGNVTESPFVGSAVANRLKKHLSALKIDDGETMHSFRSGCSITLSLLGVSYEQVARHVGWKSLDMAVYYTQFDKVMAVEDASSVVAYASRSNLGEDSSKAENLGKEFRNRNFLKGYKPLFH